MSRRQYLDIGKGHNVSGWLFCELPEGVPCKASGFVATLGNIQILPASRRLARNLAGHAEYVGYLWDRTLGIGPTHDHFIDLQGWLTHTHWHGLPILAADANALVQGQIVADH